MPVRCGLSPSAQRVSKAVEEVQTAFETLRTGTFELGNLTALLEAPAAASKKVNNAVRLVSAMSAPLNLLDEISDAADQIKQFANVPIIGNIVRENLSAVIWLKYGEMLESEYDFSQGDLEMVFDNIVNGTIDAELLCGIMPNIVVDNVTGMTNELPQGLHMSDKDLEEFEVAGLVPDGENFLNQYKISAKKINGASALVRSLDFDTKDFFLSGYSNDDFQAQKVDVIQEVQAMMDKLGNYAGETPQELIDRLDPNQLSSLMRLYIGDVEREEATETANPDDSEDEEEKTLLELIEDAIKYGYVPDNEELADLAGTELYGATLPPGMELPDPGIVRIKRYGTTSSNDKDDYGRVVKDYPETLYWGTERRWYPGWTQISPSSGAYNDFGEGYSPCYSAPIKITNSSSRGAGIAKGWHFEFGTPLIWISLVPGGPPVNDPDYAQYIAYNSTNADIKSRNERFANGDYSAWRRGIRWKRGGGNHGQYACWRHRDLNDEFDDGTPWDLGLPLIVGKTYFLNLWWHSSNLGYAGFALPAEPTGKGHPPLWRGGGWGRGGEFWKNDRLNNHDGPVLSVNKIPTVGTDYTSFVVKTYQKNQVLIPFDITPGSTGGEIRFYVPTVDANGVPLSNDPKNRNNVFQSRTVKPAPRKTFFDTNFSTWHNVSISETPGGPSKRSEWVQPFDSYWYDVGTNRPYAKITYYVTDDEDFIYRNRKYATFNPGPKRMYIRYYYPGVNYHFYGEKGNVYFEVRREESYEPLPALDQLP